MPTKQLTIGTAAIRIIKANNTRKWFLIRNIGATNAYLSNLPSLTITNGMLLATNEPLLASNKQDFPTELEVYAISSGAGTTIAIWEEQT